MYTDLLIYRIFAFSRHNTQLRKITPGVDCQTDVPGSHILGWTYLAITQGDH